MFRACLSTDSCPLLAVPCQLSFFLLVLPLFSVVLAQGGDEYGQFAPQDAYLDGSPLAYYGSENEWSQRMFSGRTADQFHKRRGQRQLLGLLDFDTTQSDPEVTFRIVNIDGQLVNAMAVKKSQLLHR